jgi:hypothetical protein
MACLENGPKNGLRPLGDKVPVLVPVRVLILVKRTCQLHIRTRM